MLRQARDEIRARVVQFVIVQFNQEHA